MHVCQLEVTEKMYKIYSTKNSTTHKNLQLLKNLHNYNTRNSANVNHCLPQKQTNTDKIALIIWDPRSAKKGICTPARKITSFRQSENIIAL